MHRELYGGPTARVRSPLVGRDAELDRLRMLYERARTGEPCLGLVWGEAGIGKTRLLREFVPIARDGGAAVAQSTCFEGACPPFAPFVEAFESLGIAAGVATGGPPWLTPAAAEAAKYRRFLAAQRALREASAREPVVVVLDDLQWADLASLECLAYLARNLGDARILLLGAVRSDDIERDPARLESIARLRREAADCVDLRPLADAEMRRLLVNLWPAGEAASRDAIERIQALSDGKPYFAEELVNSALEASVAPGHAQAPLSIRAGVLGRFGRLEPEGQRILGHAAVMGNRFDAAFLASLVELPIESVWRVLAIARDVQLVREEANGEFTFRHAITREVLYRELLTVQAQVIHREIAERLERRGGSVADASQLAYHWTASGDATRAIDANERAGDLAGERNAYRDAERAYRQAVEACEPRGRRYANLCEKLSRALSISGELDEARLWGERAIGAYSEAGDTVPAASFALRLARRSYEVGEPLAAIERTQEVLRWLGDATDETSRALRFDACVSLAHFAALQGRAGEAFGWLERAEAVEGVRPAALRHAFHLVRAFVRSTDAQIARAFEDYEEALRLAREIGDDERLIWTLNNYASRAMNTGRAAVAVDAYREAVAIAERNGLRKVMTMATQGLALALLLAGDLTAAEAAHARGIELGPGSVLAQVTAAAVGLRLADLRGDDEGAARYATSDSLETAFRSGESQNIGLLAGSASAFLEGTGRRAEAATLRSRALGDVRSADLSFWILDRCATSGDASELQRARAILEDAARDPDNVAARAHLLLFDARRLLRAGKKRDGADAAKGAAALFERIGWPWEQGQALELAGSPAEALELYRRLGYLRDADRVARARRRLRHRAHASQLTPRETEVAQLAASGLSNRLIAERLGIGERTVETHIAALFDRFDLTSRSKLGALLERP